MKKEERRLKIIALIEYFDYVPSNKTESTRRHFLQNQLEDSVNHTEFDTEVLSKFEEEDGSVDVVLYGLDYLTRLSLSQLLAKYTHT